MEAYEVWAIDSQSEVKSDKTFLAIKDSPGNSLGRSPEKGPFSPAYTPNLGRHRRGDKTPTGEMLKLDSFGAITIALKEAKRRREGGRTWERDGMVDGRPCRD